VAQAQDEYQARVQAMNAELASLRTERARWQHRVDMMQADAVDRDLLDEEARDVLGRVHKNGSGRSAAGDGTRISNAMSAATLSQRACFRVRTTRDGPIKLCNS